MTSQSGRPAGGSRPESSQTSMSSMLSSICERGNISLMDDTMALYILIRSGR